MKRSVSAILACTASCLITNAVVGLDTDGRTEKELGALAEDIEIMQRVIDKRLQQHSCTALERWHPNMFGEPWVQFLGKEKGNKKDTDLAYRFALGAVGLAQQGQRRLGAETRGYYVPTVGAVFQLELKIGTKQIEVPEEETPDLWERTRGEVRGRKERWPASEEEGKRAKRTTIDHGALDDAVEVLVETIGEYGSRMSRLEASESIIAACDVSPVWAWRPVGRSVPGTAFTEPLLSSTYTVVYPGFRAGMEYRVTIKAPMESIRDLAENRIDQDAFKDLVTITKYRLPAKGDQWSAPTPDHE
jgi:hypothetical protein